MKRINEEKLRPISNEEVERILNDETVISSYGSGSGCGSGSGDGLGCGCGCGEGSGSGCGCGSGEGSGEGDPTVESYMDSTECEAVPMGESITRLLYHAMLLIQ